MNPSRRRYGSYTISSVSSSSCMALASARMRRAAAESLLKGLEVAAVVFGEPQLVDAEQFAASSMTARESGFSCTSE